MMPRLPKIFSAVSSAESVAVDSGLIQEKFAVCTHSTLQIELAQVRLRSSPKFTPTLRPAANRNDRLRQRFWILRADHDHFVTAILNFSYRARTVCGHHRRFQSQGFEHNVGQSFVARGKNKQVCVPEV